MINKTEDKLHGSDSVYSRFQEYLGEFVYGGIDGSITTFAVVAGASGAGLDSSIVIILGFANLFADGFSMSVGAYLSIKSERDTYEKHKCIEYWEVENMAEQERKEVRDIFREKGFEGELLDKVVHVITADKDRWVETMMKNELEMIPSTKNPLTVGAMTFFSFLAVGFIPLLVYVLDYFADAGNANTFLYASILTFITFVFIGFLKSYVNETSRFKGIIETVLLGAVAAGVAYWVGNFLEKLIH
ncbi:MAG: VIT1/CCC1 transporter family protein [Chitinophagales bacterium]|nr:VIT1/CCC1 transporter family protein [Chitinophagales bacterium]